MKLIFLIATLMLFTAVSFADQAEMISYKISLQEIVENGADCVKEIRGNNVYLKEDSIFISEYGVYLSLNVNGDIIHIPKLHSDGSGCFLKFVDDRYEAGQYHDVTKKCPGCGLPYFVYCKNKNCPLKKKDK